MTAAFTPGPWDAEGDTIHGKLENDANIVIALANPYQELRTGPEYANARLMAAAPELYEALRVLRDYGCPACSGDCGSANPQPIFCPMEQASTALAKARGEQA